MSWERSKAKRLKIHQKGGGDIQGCRAQAVPAKPDTNLQAWKTPFRPLTSLAFFSQPSVSLLYLRGRQSTWHLQTAVIQGSEGSPSTPASLSLESSLCHNEPTCVAEWGGSGGWMGGETLFQAGWALPLPEFNIHVLHHLGCTLVQSSAPERMTLGQARGSTKVAREPLCNG